MKNIARLLNDLNKMTAISAAFWTDIQEMMEEKQKKNGFMFLKPGQISTRAWYLTSGFILALSTDRHGADVVEKIYFSSDVVTDLASFFEESPVRFKFIGAGDVHALEINRESVAKLEKYPETQKLIQHIAFLENNRAEEIRLMDRMTDEDQVASFLEKYPVSGLPEHYCASFLNIPLDRYLALLKSVAVKHHLIPRASRAEPNKELSRNIRVAYMIMEYLSENYRTPDIGNTRKIADLFNMTSVTLNRLFIKSFGLTVHKFITKQRMENAEKSLQLGTSAVGKVALSVGYKNIFHFSKAFKSYFGYPPKQGKSKKHL